MEATCQIIFKGLSYKEVEKIKRILGSKLMKKAEIDYGVSVDVELPWEFDELPDIAAKRCALDAWCDIKKCNIHLDAKRDEHDVRQRICDVFRDDVVYAVKKMQGCGRNKFICRIVGMMYFDGYYGRTSVDVLAEDLHLLYKGSPNGENSRRYIFKADKDEE